MPKIGRYEVQRELGRGAMGVVYLAHDPRLHRQVAVKTYTLPEGVSGEVAKEFHERFLREAQAAASLSHPGIVTIYDAGEDSAKGFPYIAMEFVPGQSLRQRLEKGDRLDPSWVLTFGAVLADALHLAHRAGIIHRDIKPANILIREGDGAAKIADFGVARLQASDLTQSGAALGSPGYMSPEQIRCVPLDGRSDLFSLAVVLYEALCGKRPFHGDDLASLVYSIAHDTQVPLSRRLGGCPAGLDRFFDRALSKDPERRFADGAAFKKAFLEGGEQAAVHPVDQTVLEAATREVMPAPNQALRAGMDGKPAPSDQGRSPAGRGRSLALKVAAVALLSIGLAAAAYLRLGRPGPLKAEAPPIHARPETAAGAGRQGPIAGGAVTHETAERRDRTPPPPRKEAVKKEAVQDVEPVPQAPRIPRAAQVTVPPGTEIRLALDTPVGSSASHAGDAFTATITDPVVAGDRVAIPAGSRVHGRVSEAIPARKGLSNKAGSLSLAFDRVATTDGFVAPISASMTRVAPKSTKKTAGIIGGSAAGGALLGKILGGNNNKAVLGSVVGGAIGAGIAAGTKGEDVDLPAGSPVAIKLDQPLTISINP
ncbi:MAG: hypothetical protein DMF50_01620 [Acidobacteria bacterium]|nr:MAG: hypothetical protein DMF50_01620 [Acidobacteriota bacterium]